ncbi:MAG: hypothetical protein ACK44F_06770 [Roseococcus sp.]|jgi:cytosine/adenosine deaminase-related metal-dependent hydrolase
MTLSIRNAIIVTDDDAGTLHVGGAIAVTGQRIAAVGPDAEIAARCPGAAEAEGGGRAVLAGTERSRAR